MRGIHVDVVFDALSIGIDIPLGPVSDWFEGVRQVNAASRAREGGSSVPALTYMAYCPHCGAHAISLTSIETDVGRQGTCYKCRVNFELGA